MLHEKFTALLRSGLRNVARLDYDHPKKVILALLALSSTLVLGAAPSVVEWVNYPCGGTIYDGDACYPQLADIAGPLNGKMHATRAFLFDHFAAEPWPRKAEVIVEPAHRCLRCPSPIMDCVLEHDFDVCWEADGTSHAPDSSSLEPLPPSALAAIVEMQSTLTELGLADVCWKDVPALGCHPANVSSSEFGAAVGAPAKAVWVPLELSGLSLASSLQTSFGGADGTLPPALKYSFFLTGVTDPVHEGDFPSKYSRGALELENSFHVAMKEIQARAAALPPSTRPAHPLTKPLDAQAAHPELVLSWITQSQPMTEFAMELFPPMLMCLPVAFSVLITVVLLAFTTVGGDGKLALPLTKAALVDPVLCIVVANLSVMASFGLYCLLFPFVFMGHIFGASIGLAIGIDGMLVMNSCAAQFGAVRCDSLTTLSITSADTSVARSRRAPTLARHSLSASPPAPSPSRSRRSRRRSPSSPPPSPSSRWRTRSGSAARSASASTGSSS